jgi:2-oxoglutarate ferredoxin oxidoreductase subunit delta
MPRIDVDEKRCKACELCIVACPKEVIGLAKHFSSSGFHPACMEKPEACTGCKLCAFVCPDVAIEVYK